MATEIQIADKTTLDEVKTKIGTSGDAASMASTLYAALKYLASYMGTNTDAASMTSSLFAAIKTVAAYTDTLETNLGSNSSPANAVGDVHAKLKDLKIALTTAKNTVTVQRGLTALDLTRMLTITISPVDISKSFVIASVRTTSNSNEPSCVAAQLIDSTTLRFTRYDTTSAYGSGNQAWVEWQVIQIA